MSEKYCTIYIKQDKESQKSAQEIEKSIREGKIPEKIKALKQLIINIVNDESFPRMVMTVVNVLVPLTSETHDIKKVLFYYWEVIEKLKPDGELRDEMILVCNSIRKDLLHANEWVRGRTLRLISRIMFRGLLEPLASAVLENLEHKHVYVRRNAIVALNRIYMHFGEDILSDIDDDIHKILLNESDLSTKRNAFQLLFFCNQSKALEYLNQQVKGETTEEMGDILQLMVLELFRKSCKFDISQKSRLINAVFYFSKSKSSSVLLECANTLIQISNSNTTNKLAVQIYMQILTTVTDNNVKMIVLDKISEIQQKNQSKYLQEQVIDLSNILHNQSQDIRKKTLNLIEKLTNQSNVSEIFHIMVKEVKSALVSNQNNQNNDYLISLFQSIIHFTSKYGEVLSEEALVMISDSLLTNSKIDENLSFYIKDILVIIAISNPQMRQQLITNIISKFFDIQTKQLYKGALWLISEFAEEQNIIQALEEIKRSVGPMPLVIKQKKQNNKNNSDEPAKKKTRIKTILLPDNTYGTQIVEEDDVNLDEQNEIESKFRDFLVENSYLSSSLAKTLLRLLYKIRDQQKEFNLHSSQTIMIFISFLRFYSSNLSKADQDVIEKLNLGIRLLTNPQIFLNGNIPWLSQNQEYIHPELRNAQQQNATSLNQFDDFSAQSSSVAKQPDDIITIRGLKGKTVVGEIDIEDEEHNELDDILNEQDKKQDFVSKLSSLVQLTGLSDPIYAEAFVQIHKYDIQFEVLLVNRTSKFLQNISVEFNTQGDWKVLEKAQPVNLQPNKSAMVKTSIKFSAQDIGLIFGNINYENSAGIEQAYIITQEINVDLIDFIIPKDVDMNAYRQKWAVYGWENRINLNTNIRNLKELVEHFEKHLKLRYLGDKEQLLQSQYVCANFYAVTKMDDDFLINLSAELVDGKILGYARIRATNKGIVVNLGEKIKVLQNKSDN